MRSYNDAILKIIKIEVFRKEGHFGADSDTTWKKFISIAPEIKRAYLKNANIKDIE